MRRRIGTISAPERGGFHHANVRIKFLVGASCSRPPSTLVAHARAADYALTAPAVIPVTKYLCSEKKTTSGGTIEMKAAALIMCHSVA